MREVYHSFLGILTTLFNKSFSTGYVPLCLKLAKIVPVYKSGEATDCNNYRPISLLSTYGKLMEKVVAPQILAHLNRNSILSDFQFGFRPKHSTIHPVTLFCDHIYKSFLEGKYVASVFIDLKNHSIW